MDSTTFCDTAKQATTLPRSKPARLERATFQKPRTLEYFSVEELTKQIGHERRLWPIALLKELIDNSLDACEAAGTPPTIEVTVGDDYFAVRDNGPGIPPDTVFGSLDYNVRVSDKLHYVSPTRGQQGNALKTLWAAPLVASGKTATVQVSAHGACHTIGVSLDRIAGEPKICRSTAPAKVKTGTLIDVRWPGVAGYLAPRESADFYSEGAERPLSAEELLAAYSATNPHAEFLLPYAGGRTARFSAGNVAWRKWLTSWPTSVHWYGATELESLIVAYIRHDGDGGIGRTVRQFVGEFDGLKGSKSQTHVVADADLAGSRLADLLSGGDVDAAKVARLRQVMMGATRPVKPARLGVIGHELVADRLERLYRCGAESVRYKRKEGIADDLPFVLEVGLGVHDDERRRVVAGLNWSPAIQSPFRQLEGELGRYRVDDFDPVTVFLHLAYPRPNYRDRGKSTLALPHEIHKALAECIRSVAKDHHKEKRRADQNDRLNKPQLDRLKKASRPKKLDIKTAASGVMEEAYMLASAGGTLPANARQIMYAARPRVLQVTGGKCWKNSSYFTQILLPKFVEDNPELTADWDVVYDDRGHFREPHTSRRVGLGTMAVRNYVAQWTGGAPADVGAISVDADIPTCGPANRYRFALFVEKEGFDALLQRSQIAERFDVAIMSTKGMSVTASRTLVEKLSAAGVTVLVLRDFDKTGFSIVHTLGHDTRRYRFSRPPNVIDIGLRLSDARNMRLIDEECVYTSKIDPRDCLAECGAAEEERAFLVSGGRPKHWTGRRVELNAMDSRQFVEFVETKLREWGAQKLVPTTEVLEAAYRRAAQAKYIRDHSAELLDAAREHAKAAEVPNDLADDVARRLEENPADPWDHAVVACLARSTGRDERNRARKESQL